MRETEIDKGKKEVVRNREKIQTKKEGGREGWRMGREKEQNRTIKLG